MNKNAQIEFDMETVAAIGMGLLAGGLALVVMKSTGLNLFWRILTLVASSIAGAVVSYIIFTK